MHCHCFQSSRQFSRMNSIRLYQRPNKDLTVQFQQFSWQVLSDTLWPTNQCIWQSVTQGVHHHHYWLFNEYVPKLWYNETPTLLHSASDFCSFSVSSLMTFVFLLSAACVCSKSYSSFNRMVSAFFSCSRSRHKSVDSATGYLCTW